MIENVKQEVKKLLNKDNFGHGMDHIDRVLNLSLRFAKKEKANIYLPIAALQFLCTETR